MSNTRAFARAWILALALAFSCSMFIVAPVAFAAGEQPEQSDIVNGENPAVSVPLDLAISPNAETASSSTSLTHESANNTSEEKSEETVSDNGASDSTGSTKADPISSANGSQPAATSSNQSVDNDQDTVNVDQKKTDQDIQIVNKDNVAENISAASGVVVQGSSEEDAKKEYEATHENMFRLYNPYSGEHLYTHDFNEATTIAKIGWRWEGIGWIAPKISDSPVFRLCNPFSGDHHYTLDSNERDTLRGIGWNYEGIGWYSDAADQIAVLREFNPYEEVGTHNYTADVHEDEYLGSIGWHREGVAWYATKGDAIAIDGFWLVTSSWGTNLERYWIDSTGSVAKNRVVDPANDVDEGCGYRAYATSSGAIARGKWNANNGYVYVASDDGRLFEPAVGWTWTDAYDGSSQLYWFETTSLGMVGARTGFFTVDANYYYGRGDTGYVVRGKYDIGKHVILADNDGKILTGTGWLSTSSFDASQQTYWLERVYSEASAALVGMFHPDNDYYYGTPGVGYIARNQYLCVDSNWYYADGNGKVTPALPPEQQLMVQQAQGFSSDTGWLVLVNTDTCNVGVFSGSAYNWGLQFYWSCVCGAYESPTITGEYATTGLHTNPLPSWQNARFATQIHDGYFFHTVLESDDELGQHLSHGCVRLSEGNAIWIYDNLPAGTTVYLY